MKRRKQAGYVPAGAFVNAYLGLGEDDQALAWLEQAYKEQSNILQFVRVHPFFDPLRDDPRFADLVRPRRGGLGPEAGCQPLYVAETDRIAGERKIDVVSGHVDWLECRLIRYSPPQRFDG